MAQRVFPHPPLAFKNIEYFPKIKIQTLALGAWETANTNKNYSHSPNK